MRLSILSFIIYISIIGLLASCSNNSLRLTTCKDLPNIAFKNSQVGIDKELTLKILVELAAAAKKDAEISKDITTEASLKVKSEFGKVFKENTSGSQNVSDDFWEQNITLTQLLCNAEAQSRRSDLTADQKNGFILLVRNIMNDRNEYLKQRSLKKKNGESPN